MQVEVNLNEVIEQAVPQIFGGDERRALLAYLGRSESQVVNVDVDIEALQLPLPVESTPKPAPAQEPKPAPPIGERWDINALIEPLLEDFFKRYDDTYKGREAKDRLTIAEAAMYEGFLLALDEMRLLFKAFESVPVLWDYPEKYKV